MRPPLPGAVTSWPCNAPSRPWLEALEECKVRLKQVVADINAEHDVAGLCRELPDRVAKLDELQGGRLPK